MPDVDVLTGARVRLRRPVVDDAEALFADVTSDLETTRYLSWLPHPNVAETRRVITEFFNVGDEQTWLVELDGAPIGLCGCRRPTPHTRDLGYVLGRRWWRRGLMSEAVATLRDALEQDPDVYRISAYCHVDIVGSAAVLRRCGLDCEGRLARYAVFPNLGPEPQDCWQFAKAVR
jgi:[ribosomal protein S5]-alanine N-acetyltransferase